MTVYDIPRANTKREWCEIDPNVKPATEKWLTDHNYSFSSEVKMPISGRADYIAYHPNGHCLIVECKSSALYIQRSIAQVLDYQTQYDQKAQAALAIPIHTISDSVRNLCQKRKLLLIELDVPAPLSKGNNWIENWEFAVRIVVAERLRFQSEQIIGEILRFHSLRDTDPRGDLGIVLQVAMKQFALTDDGNKVNRSFARQVRAVYLNVINSFNPPHETWSDAVEYDNHIKMWKENEFKRLFAKEEDENAYVTQTRLIELIWDIEKRAELGVIEGQWPNYVSPNSSYIPDWPGAANNFSSAEEWCLYWNNTHESYLSALVEREMEYYKLIAEGFTSVEAKQWLDQYRDGNFLREWLIRIWRKRNASGKDFIALTDRISEIVHGKSATQRKREMGLPRHDTPRNYDPASALALTALTELMSGMLHERRDSLGVRELIEDVDDTRPIVDSARPEVERAFSKKPRRLPSGRKPLALSDENL